MLIVFVDWQDILFVPTPNPVLNHYLLDLFLHLFIGNFQMLSEDFFSYAFRLSTQAGAAVLSYVDFNNFWGIVLCLIHCHLP